ncbi:hypothetical protein GDO81_010515 [Engystomops pustulosus]|uniref:Uncharacterized protein n=1 Tax=Engystomops pustulosus TaxID=76066 RepID=A0AAV7C0K9_ENGPU|nr:hypothetical protein GDO81_010515 [Engystomops pustulosus]
MLSKFQIEQEDIKRRKWHRDLEDYQLGRVYNWKFEDKKPNGYQTKGNIKKRKRQNSKPKSPTDHNSFLEEVSLTPDSREKQPGEGASTTRGEEKSPQAKQPMTLTATRKRKPSREHFFDPTE